jgi:hypothetical protein
MNPEPAGHYLQQLAEHGRNAALILVKDRDIREVQQVLPDREARLERLLEDGFEPVAISAPTSTGIDVHRLARDDKNPHFETASNWAKDKFKSDDTEPTN